MNQEESEQNEVDGMKKGARSVYVPLVRFSPFVRYQEKRKTTPWTVFLIPRALRKANKKAMLSQGNRAMPL